MKNFITIKHISSAILVVILMACGSKPNADDPMAQLAALKEQKTALDAQITELEKQLEAKGLI